MDLMQACCNSNDLLYNILLGIRQSVIVTDEQGIMLYSNPIAEKMFDYTSEELKGNNISILFDADDLKYLYPNLLHMGQNNERFEGEMKLKKKKGQSFFIHMTLRPSIRPSNNGKMLVFCIQDIDREKELEKSYRNSNYDDLIQIANGIAHELRNPLMGIGGFINRLHNLCAAAKDHEEYYQYIIANLKKIEKLVKDVEYFANLPKPTYSETPIQDILKMTIGPLEKKIQDKHINLSISSDRFNLIADTDLIIRVFSILIENSIDALGEGGSIKIHTLQSTTDVVIYVEDDGDGISEEDYPFIFNPFFSTKADGAGIDLATAKRIIESHGGNIEVNSKYGEGTTFMIMLPLERRRSLRTSSLNKM